MIAFVHSKRSKFGNVRTEVDGITFASKREAGRYQELRLLERGGEIANLVRQPRYPLIVNGQPICTYVADFTYQTRAGKPVVEDSKGFRTPEFKIKAALMRACLGIEVVLS